MLKEPDFLGLLCSAAYQAGPLLSPAKAGHVRAARCAADADIGPQRRRGRSPGRLQRPGERVSQGGVDAVGVSDLPAPFESPPAASAGGEACKLVAALSIPTGRQPVGVAEGAITSPPPYSNTFSTGTMRMFSRLIFKGKRVITSSSFNTAAGRDAGYVIGLGASAARASASAPGVLRDDHDLEIFILEVLGMAALTSCWLHVAASAAGRYRGGCP